MTRALTERERALLDSVVSETLCPAWQVHCLQYAAHFGALDPYAHRAVLRAWREHRAAEAEEHRQIRRAASMLSARSHAKQRAKQDATTAALRRELGR